MSIAFHSVHLSFDRTNAPQKLTQTVDVKQTNPDVKKVHKAGAAIQAFRMQYSNNADHHFGYQRIAIANVQIIGDTSVKFDILFELTDDSNYSNLYEGAVQVLVIAEVTVG